MSRTRFRVYLIVCYYHLTYAFQSESTLYSCLNVKEPFARSRREQQVQHNSLLEAGTTQLNQLASLAKWLSVHL